MEPEQITDRADLVVDPRGARPLAIAALVLAAAALVLIPPITGTLGMVFGTVAHVKGDSLGIKGAVAAGVAMVVGMALQALLFGSGGVAA